MAKRIIRRCIVFVLMFCIFSGFAVSAAVPFDSYTYWSEISEDKKAVYNRPMYQAEDSIGALDIGVENFTKIKNIATDKNGNIYILDSKSRIVITDKDFNLIREIAYIDGKESYDEANSLYVANDKTIYICDTEQHRILHITSEGTLIEVIGLPESPLIPEDFDYRPMQMAIDSHGYTYILSDGSYYGALLFDKDMSFLGFFGANTVKATVSSVLNNIINRVFPNNEKKKNMARTLPYCFVDLCLDNEDFVYTTTGFTTALEREGQIRRLNPGMGENILNSEEVNFVDTQINNSYKRGKMAKQDILSIDVDNNGFVYALESCFGKVYMYDSECRMITSFGGGMGEGDQVGTFVSVTSLAINGEDILVSDGATNLITVFKPTEYGAKVKELLTLTLKGKYDDIKDGWNEVLTLDRSFQPAYSGLARVALNEENYSEALKLAKQGYDRETYAIAFEMQRQSCINDNFAIIFILIIVVVAGLIVFLVIVTKKKIRFIKNEELHLMMTTIMHPSNNFTEIKEKKKGSVGLGAVLILLFYVVTVLQTLAGGFLFTYYDPASFNSLWVLLRTVGLVMMWIVVNWLVCTLSNGKGKLKEIFIVTTYSLIPLILERLLNLILTNILVPSEASFLSIFTTVATLYFILMLTIGMLKIHDFSLLRFIGTSLLSIIGIAIVVFILFLIVILLQQLGGFVLTVAMEIYTL